MTRATSNDKTTVVDILTSTFSDNKSVEYILKDKNPKRLHSLMSYSFEYCMMFGEVLLSEQKNACALIIYPDKKHTTFKSLILDFQLALKSVGIKKLAKTLHRERCVKNIQPNEQLLYLWYIAVRPGQQNGGIGGQLIEEIKQLAARQKRRLCLETSTLKNVPWYEKRGFHTYASLDFGFTLYCMKIF